ncbi:MAG: YbcC family protein [Chitinophagales bacterium]|jgi:uncharacterized protein YbcC (UPF0753/DUF2309 family)
MFDHKQVVEDSTSPGGWVVSEREDTGSDVGKILHTLRHYLPTQTPLKDFIHHNSLHAFQNLSFFEALFKANRLFGYNTTLSLEEYRRLFKSGRIQSGVLSRIIQEKKGAKSLDAWMELCLHHSFPRPEPALIGRLREFWKTRYQLDLDNAVQPTLFRIIGAYLDQGIASRHFPFEQEGLLAALRKVERNSFTSFFQTDTVRALLLDEQVGISALLNQLVGNTTYYEHYLFDQQFSHKGWSGMVAILEEKPESLLYPKKISLKDFVQLELLLELDVLEAQRPNRWEPLGKNIPFPPISLEENLPFTALQEVLQIWQLAFEWSYYDGVLAGVKHLKKSGNPSDSTEKSFQSIFCIDERECSIRRHLEASDPACETLGCPGFFGVEFYFQPENGRFYEKLCPVNVQPKYLIKESGGGASRKRDELYHQRSHHPLQGFWVSLSLGLVSAVKLTGTIFRPKKNAAHSDAFAHMHLTGKLSIENTGLDQRENGLQIGFTVEEMADRVEKLFRGIGLTHSFAPLVYVVAHGSSSANNPHHGAYDCGACSGRPGSVNARVLAYMANHPNVRALLASRGLPIPEKTWLVAALHDTSAELIAFYDEEQIPVELLEEHETNKGIFDRALDLNARERSTRFASIDSTGDLKKIRTAIQKRSVSFFEPRPELGHGTNALCFVGHRSLTKGLFLDRRAFMNSYNYQTDPEGILLKNVMDPLPPVCGGINLEYYFSRVDNERLGAGSKLPHNINGLIGVTNSIDGDLRPGLPLQMVEVHDPVRLLILVEHFPEVVLRTIQSSESLYEWFLNEWVHLMAIHPTNGTFYYFHKGVFQPYEPSVQQPPELDHLKALLHRSHPKVASHIEHSTKENLPVHLVKPTQHGN